jgi:peptidyl-prolyl cis-trans isomerase A (cyclophilin A)
MVRAMRTCLAILGMTLAVSGCDKAKTNNPAPSSGGGQSSGGGNPTPGGDTGGGAASAADVKPPTAADLAAYTKDLPGTGDKLFAKFETPLGEINCELFPDKAPATVANFVGLATGKKAFVDSETRKVESGKKFYDGLIFHRVIPGFMIQGGDPTGTGRGGPGYRFEDEVSPAMDMGPGQLAMANAGPATNGSQFFIMEGSAKPLAAKHTIFGQCKEVEVVTKITHTPAVSDRPNEPVTMKVTITKG